MSKTNIVQETDGTMTVTLTGVTRSPFAYRPPRCPFKYAVRCIRGVDWQYVGNTSGLIITSAGLISAGILIGLNPIGAFLAFTGFCLPFGERDTQTPEEYRQFVIEHFEKRGEQPPRWTQVVKRGQVWRHRGTLNLILRRCYQVVSVRDGVARCLVTDTNGKPITSNAMIQDIGTRSLRYAYKQVEEVSHV